MAHLTLMLAAELSLTPEGAMSRTAAEAWKTLLVDGLTARLDARLGPDAADPPDRPTLLAQVHVQKAEAFIEARPDEIDGVRDIAGHVGVSERTLQSAFRRLRGATPTQVLTQANLHRARRALLAREGHATVAAVCRMCGIEHHGRFSRRYWDTFGESPVETLTARRTR